MIRCNYIYIYFLPIFLRILERHCVLDKIRCFSGRWHPIYFSVLRILDTLFGSDNSKIFSFRMTLTFPRVPVILTCSFQSIFLPSFAACPCTVVFLISVHIFFLLLFLLVLLIHSFVHLLVKSFVFTFFCIGISLIFCYPLTFIILYVFPILSSLFSKLPFLLPYSHHIQILMVNNFHPVSPKSKPA